MSAIISSENLTFEYDAFEEGGEKLTALKELNLDIEEGSFVAILGRNGSGKSTLAKNFNGLYSPTSGRVLVAGMDTADEKKIWDIRSTAGMVFQNPDNQIVAAIVEDDVAFGPENIGVPADEMRDRVDEAMKSTGVYQLRHKAPSALSGGQKQRVAIAGVIAMKPRCIIFDEPTAMLDPGGRRDVMDIIHRLHSEGITVVLITHFMEEACQADRAVIMNDGRVVLDGRPEEVFSAADIIEECGLKLPPGVRLAAFFRDRGLKVPENILTVEELAGYLGACGEKDLVNSIMADLTNQASGENASGCVPAPSQSGKADSSSGAGDGTAAAAAGHLLEVKNLTHIYNKGRPDEALALDDVSFCIDPGEFIGIIGHTGSGKSTLLQHLNGLLKPASGSIIPEPTPQVRHRIGLVFQYPEYQLFEETVAADVAFGPGSQGLSPEEKEKRVREALELVSLPYEEFADRSPFELSGGQKRRAAIAGVLAMHPEILILDEPTAGLDPQAHRDILDMIRNIKDSWGCSIILVSHNMDDVNTMCDRVLVMDSGKLVLQGSPREVFSRKEFLKGIGLGLPAEGELLYALEKLQER